MAWDLALGPTDDLVISSHKDLLGVSGLDLVEQRIRLRLKIVRGSWIYDETGALGSRVASVIGKSSDQAMSELTAYVHEALALMEDIVISNVTLEAVDKDRSIKLTVKYLTEADNAAIPFSSADTQVREAVITFPH